MYCGYILPACSRVWEYNDEGSIPYVPWFRAPYYVWVGRVPRLETLLVENKASFDNGWRLLCRQHWLDRWAGMAGILPLMLCSWWSQAWAQHMCAHSRRCCHCCC
jgi:hypothetical protein